MGHNLLDGSHARAGLHGKHIANDKEHQLSFGAHDGMEAAPRLVKSLKGPKKSFNAVGGARKCVGSQGRFQVVEFLLRLRNPRVQATVLCAFFSGETS